jgi:hypothetical protein
MIYKSSPDMAYRITAMHYQSWRAAEPKGGD